jgi:predicted DCC family thiol-disulfide oxidoreductase YuxK
MTVDNGDSSVVIFDGTCNLCNGAVNFIIKRDPEARFLFTPGQSNAASRLASQHNIHESFDETFVLIKENQCYYRSDAALEIASQLTGGWRFLRVLHLMAGHRYGWFGRRDVCMTPTDDVARRFVN